MELFHAEDFVSGGWHITTFNQICTETGHLALVEVDEAVGFMCHTTAKAPYWGTGQSGDHDLCFLNVALYAKVFTLLFHIHQEAFYFFFIFCHKGDVICISEVIDISPGNLDSSCASYSPAFRMMYSSYKLNKQSDNTLTYSFPNLDFL